MNLAVDIGNSRKKFAFFRDGKVCKSLVDRTAGLRYVKGYIKREQVQVEHVIVSSTAHVSDTVKEEIEGLSPHVIWMDQRGSYRLPVPVGYKHHPGQLGTDRIAAAIGALEAYPGPHLLVIDAGTCLTIDLVSSEGRFEGGNISPGVETRLRAIYKRTAHLPKLTAAEAGKLPLLGGDTRQAILAGVMHGVKYEILGYARLLKAKYADLLVVFTGGSRLPQYDELKGMSVRDDLLVMKGLQAILNYNVKNE